MIIRPAVPTDIAQHLDGVYDGDEDWVIDLVKEIN